MELLTSTLQRLDGAEAPTVDIAVQGAVEASCSVLSVTGAGLMVLDESRALRYVAASDEGGRIMEVVQEETGQGPCVDALILGKVVMTPDVTADERWPKLHDPLAGGPVRAVLGTPIEVVGASVGTLNVYADGPQEWDESDQVAIAGFAHLIEHLLSVAVLAHQHSQVVDQLQNALDRRVVIERAIGMVMGQNGCDPVTAFNRLRRSARDSGRKVADVAGDLLAGESA
jgi:GAF domain-containing protein